MSKKRAAKKRLDSFEPSGPAPQSWFAKLAPDAQRVLREEARLFLDGEYPKLRTFRDFYRALLACNDIELPDATEDKVRNWFNRFREEHSGGQEATMRN